MSLLGGDERLHFLVVACIIIIIIVSLKLSTFHSQPTPHTDGFLSDGEQSTDLRETNGSASTDGSDESRHHHNPLTMSTYSTRNNSLTASMFSQHIMTRSLPTIDGSFQSLAMLREYQQQATETRN